MAIFWKTSAIAVATLVQSGNLLPKWISINYWHQIDTVVCILFRTYRLAAHLSVNCKSTLNLQTPSGHTTTLISYPNRVSWDSTTSCSSSMPQLMSIYKLVNLLVHEWSYANLCCTDLSPLALTLYLPSKYIFDGFATSMWAALDHPLMSNQYVVFPSHSKSMQYAWQSTHWMWMRQSYNNLWASGKRSCWWSGFWNMCLGCNTPDPNTRCVNLTCELTKDQTRFLLASWLLEHVFSVSPSGFGRLRRQATFHFNNPIGADTATDNTFLPPLRRPQELSPSSSGQYANHLFCIVLSHLLILYPENVIRMHIPWVCPLGGGSGY